MTKRLSTRAHLAVIENIIGKGSFDPEAIKNLKAADIPTFLTNLNKAFDEIQEHLDEIEFILDHSGGDL